MTAKDHPRGCGENIKADAAQKGGDGSPPRMRGKLSPTVGLLFVIRITPADAGKTSLLVLGFPSL